MPHKILFALVLLLLTCTSCHNTSATRVNVDYVPANQIAIGDLTTLTSLADNGDPVAQYELGRLYFAGLGVSKSHRTALILWEKSAVAGYIPSQYALGMIYFDGIGIKRDYVDGCKWLGAAAAHGYQPAVVMYNTKCGK